MSGPKPSHPIVLTESETADVQRLIRAHMSSQALVLRAKIVVTAASHPTWSNAQIASTLHTSDRMVRTWRRCWVETHTLADAPRSGAPRRFSP